MGVDAKPLGPRHIAVEFADLDFEERVQLDFGFTTRLELGIHPLQSDYVGRRDLGSHLEIARHGVDVGLRWKFRGDRQSHLVPRLGGGGCQCGGKFGLTISLRGQGTIEQILKTLLSVSGGYHQSGRKQSATDKQQHPQPAG